MSHVLTLNDVILTIHEQLTILNDGVADGSSVLISSNATFISTGIVEGDRLFIIDKGLFTVTSTPTSETTLTVDRPISSGNHLIFSVARDIKQKIKGVINHDYPGSGDLELLKPVKFQGYISGSYQATIENTVFSYTSRDGNVLKGVSGLGSYPAGTIVTQESHQTELLFVQNLRLATRITRSETPQFRTSSKRKRVLGIDYSVDFTVLLHDLELEKRLKDPSKDYAIRVFYRIPDTFQEDGFNVMGCHLSSDSIGNQDNVESTSDFSFIGSYRDNFSK